MTMRQSSASVCTSFRRLSEFFATKDEASLSNSEINACLDWLKQASEDGMDEAPRGHSTLVPDTCRVESALSRANTAFSPVKKQILDILNTPYHKSLEESTNASLDKQEVSAPKDDSNKVPRTNYLKAKENTVYTRTARTILDALQRPSEAKTRPSEESLPFAEALEPRLKSDYSPQMADEQAGNKSPEIPFYTFNMESFNSASKSPTLPNNEEALPSFHFSW